MATIGMFRRTTVIVKDRSIYGIAHGLVHVDGLLVALSHKKINKVHVPRLGFLLQSLHQVASYTKTTVGWCHSQGRDVTMPVLARPFTLSHH